MTLAVDCALQAKMSDVSVTRCVRARFVCMVRIRVLTHRDSVTVRVLTHRARVKVRVWTHQARVRAGIWTQWARVKVRVWTHRARLRLGFGHIGPGYG